MVHQVVRFFHQTIWFLGRKDQNQEIVKKKDQAWGGVLIASKNDIIAQHQWI